MIYTSQGSTIPVEEVLQTGKTVSTPDQNLLSEAALYFSKIAKFEPFWKKQLSKVSSTVS